MSSPSGSKLPACGARPAVPGSEPPAPPARGPAQAADRLFAEQGYAQTTVRDIAEAAGVTERTFFRYFGGKEELIIDDALAWLPLLKDHVRGPPGGGRPGHRAAPRGPVPGRGPARVTPAHTAVAVQ